jgi:hypothetical protein
MDGSDMGDIGALPKDGLLALEGNFVDGIIVALEGARVETGDRRWRRGSCRDKDETSSYQILVFLGRMAEAMGHALH